MAINTEQKQRLRKLLFQVSPADGNEESIEAIEKFQKLMDEHYKLLESSHASLKSQMEVMRQEHKAHLSELETKSRSLIGKLSASVEDKSKNHKKELADTKEEFNKIVTEIRDQVRISYSKMGGGTMPILIQVETPSFVPDGNAKVYYFKYLPTYITVGGQVMIIGDGYSQPVPLVDGYNVTFDNPPMPEQTVHNFHY
jgi:uncharacterized protein YecE (DUF72 family)